MKFPAMNYGHCAQRGKFPHRIKSVSFRKTRNFALRPTSPLILDFMRFLCASKVIFVELAL